MVAISDGRPKLMGIRQIIDSYLNHQIEVVANRTKYDLDHLWKTHAYCGRFNESTINIGWGYHVNS